MAEEGGRIIVLAGAPEAEELDWREGALLDDFQTPFKSFLGLLPRSSGPSQPMLSQLSPEWNLPKWRKVPMDPDAPMGAMSFEDHDGGEAQTQFLALQNRHEDDGESQGQERQHFLEHSLVLLNELESSQIDAAPDAGLEGETSLYPSTFSIVTATTTSSFPTTVTDSSFFSASAPPAQVQPQTSLNIKASDLTDLKHVPPASYLTRIHPQTMTVNLLAAVINVSAPRIVRLRKAVPGRTEMEIIELLLGDDTKAGFSVSFWLTPVESQQPQKSKHDEAALREQLQVLRPGSIVLIKNVALHVWKNGVYGQSLSWRFARNKTSISACPDEDEDDEDGLGLMEKGVKKKLGRVRAWTWEFVGRRQETAGGLKKRKSGPRGELFLPPDTQD
jgi:hypothetical protein